MTLWSSGKLKNFLTRKSGVWPPELKPVITLSPCRTKLMCGWSILLLVSSPGVRIVWTARTRKCKLTGCGTGSGQDVWFLDLHTWTTTPNLTWCTWPYQGQRYMLQLHMRLVIPDTGPKLWQVLASGVEPRTSWSAMTLWSNGKLKNFLTRKSGVRPPELNPVTSCQLVSSQHRVTRSNVSCQTK